MERVAIRLFFRIALLYSRARRRPAPTPPSVIQTQGEHRVSKNTVGGAQLDKILDRMQNDAAFREKLLGDPAGALAEHGVDVDPSTIPAVRSLPPADAIAQQRDALKSKVDGRVGLAFFLLST
jgi:putative modified peptide